MHKKSLKRLIHILFNKLSKFIILTYFKLCCLISDGNSEKEVITIMASDVKSQVKDAVDKQYLTPVTVSDELQEKFIKKSRSSSIKLLPVSIIVSAVVLVILILLIYFMRFFIISTLGLLCIVFPIYAVYNIFATAKAIKNHDYEFFSGEVIDKTDKGYTVRGLEGQNISAFIGKKEYNPGERVIVARLNDELNLISEE